ncbi:hypothetical protein F511_14523 [Dorcoceras hygrometricum]|uniref:Uncharacterized protein n=1 Tax=Dorcoceras hygrometricum TaxID=472368 RepID=A0A2Z7BNW3_9LAMI|nr:hypothetical protein F511_14523 [Dorcoceras hygrometricum]
MESRAQNREDDVVQPSIPRRRRDRQVEDEVDLLESHVDELEMVLARFQQMNPQRFLGAEGGDVAENWLEHLEGIFDRVNIAA